MATTLSIAANRRPERGVEIAASHRRLEIEPDERDLGGGGFAMGDQRVGICRAHRAEAEQSGVVAETGCELRLGDRLSGGAAKARDHHYRARRPIRGCARRGFQHGLVEADVADGELRGVDADREPAAAGIEVIAAEGALPARIEPASGVQCQRVRRNDAALAQQVQDGGRQLRTVHEVRSLAEFRSGGSEQSLWRAG